MPNIKYAQTFCSVADLIADKDSPGADEARLMSAINEVCEYLSKRIGWFIPVTLTHRFHGRGLSQLFMPYPLLSITSITNDGTALVGADYIAKPDEGMWPYGPYSDLTVDPDAANLSEWADEADGVVIVGSWGKYLRLLETGATVQDNPQSSSQPTLKVSNGAKVSPGMIVLIGTEQEHVTGWDAPTSAVTTLGANVANTDEIITVADASLVNVGEILRNATTFEQMRVKDRNTTTNKLSVTRAWNGTAKTAQTSGQSLDVYRTVTVERGVNGTTAAEHASAAAINRYLAPYDVNMLAKQMATLLVNKARGGYQGREGNVELGTIFYNDVFVEREIDAINEQYYFGSFA